MMIVEGSEGWTVVSGESVTSFRIVMPRKDEKASMMMMWISKPRSSAKEIFKMIMMGPERKSSCEETKM